MRRVRGKIIAVCTVVAVILAAKAALTAEIPVVYAEDGSDIDKTAVLEADGEDEQDTELPASGDDEDEDGDEKDGDADKAGGGVNSGTDSADGSQKDGDTDKAGGGVNSGTDSADADSNDANGTGAADTEADKDADLEEDDDTPDDVDVEDAETLPLAGTSSTFSLRSSRSTEELVYSEADLFDAVGEAEAPNVKLAQDITLSGQISLEGGEVVTIDLNGKTITAALGAFGVYEGTLTITGNGTIDAGNSAIVVGGGSCKIANGTITSTKGSAVEVNDGAVTISDGTFTGNPYGICVSGGNATINGGKFEGTNDACLVDGSGASVSITAGTFTASKGKGLRINALGEKAKLTGGTFSSGIAVKLEGETQQNGLPVGKWAEGFYDSIASVGVLTNNTFKEEVVDGQTFYASTNLSIGFKSGSWDGSCTEIRNLAERTTYSFGEGKWTVDGDDAVYSAGSFCVPSSGTYTFAKK